MRDFRYAPIDALNAQSLLSATSQFVANDGLRPTAARLSSFPQKRESRVLRRTSLDYRVRAKTDKLGRGVNHDDKA